MTDRLLVIAAQYPLPLLSGGQVRVARLVRGLARNFRVSLTGLYSRDWGDAEEGSLDGCEACAPVPAESVTTAPFRRLLELGGGLIRGLPPAVARYRRRALRHSIEALGGLESFDAVLCEYTAAALYLPPSARLRSFAVLDEVDLSYVPLQRLAANRSGVARLITRAHARWMRDYERRLFKSFDVVVVPSDCDARQVKGLAPESDVWKVPNGVDLGGVPERPRASRPPAFVFLGGMGHLPNRDSVRWLVSEILPRIRARFPQAKLFLIGEGTEELSNEPLGVRGLGFVGDLSEALAWGDVGLAPIRIAGGTRLKLLDLMARGVPTVSTSVGAEGLDVTSGEHLLISEDDPSEFAKLAADLFARSEVKAIIAKKARRLVAEHHDWEAISANFAEQLKSALHQRKQSRLS